MGQYHKIVNVDKKEYLESDFGLKLLEWGYLKNPMNLTLLDKLSKDWKGDRVYVVGDYGNSQDASSSECAEIFSALEKELGLCDKDGHVDFNHGVYYLSDDKFKSVPLKEDLKVEDYRFIYNHNAKQFVDLNHCVPCDSYYDFYRFQNKIGYMAIAPLPLLLALSNGLGGGDYHEGCHNYNLVGSWSKDVHSLEVRNDRLDNDYEELVPEFQEGERYMSYKEAQKVKSILEEKYLDSFEDDSWIKKEVIEKVIRGDDI